jgi:hypothetical protein
LEEGERNVGGGWSAMGKKGEAAAMSIGENLLGFGWEL